MKYGLQFLNVHPSLPNESNELREELRSVFEELHRSRKNAFKYKFTMIEVIGSETRIFPFRSVSLCYCKLIPRESQTDVLFYQRDLIPE